MRSRILRALVVLLLGATAPTYALTVHQGQHVQTLDTQPGTTLLNALDRLTLSPQHYWLGARRCHQQARTQHQQLRQALMQRFRQLELLARTRQQPELAQWAQQWHDKVTQHIPTGCEHWPLDIDALVIQLPRNAFVEADEQWHIPTAVPGWVTVQGSTIQQLPWQRRQTGRTLRQQLEAQPFHDPNYLLIIQADGRIEQLGSAYWNDEQTLLSPGATVVLPLHERIVQQIDPSLNRLWARYLALFPIGEQP